MVDSIRSIQAAFGDRPVYIFVVADNGHEDGQHRYLTGKGKHFEESVQVPMFVLGLNLAGRTVNVPTYHLDIAPTLVEMAGAQSPALDGRSLVPWLRGEVVPWRAFTLLEHGKNGSAFVGLRTPRRKFAMKDTKREFYNLKLDPYELRNRCNDGDTDCGADLAIIVNAMTTCRGETCWAIETSLIPDDLASIAR
jgi:arylsulfatase A-like enzyme